MSGPEHALREPRGSAGGENPGARARRALAENPVWYHTITLAPGVATPGQVDWRRHVSRILPADLSGLRALDVGTFDGFWAFELERRGAEVVAIDVERADDAEWPPLNRARLKADAAAMGLELGRGFRLAHDCLGSVVRREICSVYDLTPDRIGGPVDLVFLGALPLHLRDPIRALERIGETLVPGGRLIAVECVSLGATLRAPRRPMANFEPTYQPFNWWRPNLRALHAYLEAAAFDEVRRLGWPLRPPARPEMRTWYCAMTGRAGPETSGSARTSGG